MKKFFITHRNKVLIFIPIVIAILTVCASGFEKRVSEIYTFYSIDVAALNNSLITLAVNSVSQDKESVRKVKVTLGVQMEKFNNKYENAERELRWNGYLASILNPIIFILLLLQMIFVVAVPTKDLD